MSNLCYYRKGKITKNFPCKLCCRFGEQASTSENGGRGKSRGFLSPLSIGKCGMMAQAKSVTVLPWLLVEPGFTYWVTVEVNFSAFT